MCMDPKFNLPFIRGKYNEHEPINFDQSEIKAFEKLTIVRTKKQKRARYLNPLINKTNPRMRQDLENNFIRIKRSQDMYL